MKRSMIDQHRFSSPQTSSSSGYHSEFSSSNESPPSIQEIITIPIKRAPTKNDYFSRFSQFFRQKYQRAKSRLLPPSKQMIPTKMTCSKATSTSSPVADRQIYSFNVPVSSSSHRPLTRKPVHCQSYYPYRYLMTHYRSNYVPLSDFLSSTTTIRSAFRPIGRKILLDSDDPCDLEVAQYFHQRSNPNYFDVYQHQPIPIRTFCQQNMTETLC